MTKSDGEEKLKQGSMRKLYSERKKEEDEGFNDEVRKLSFSYKINSDCKWFKGEIIACSYVERLLSVLSWLLSTEVIHLYLSASLFLSLESPVGNFCSFLLHLCSFQCLHFFSLNYIDIGFFLARCINLLLALLDWHAWMLVQFCLRWRVSSIHSVL